MFDDARFVMEFIDEEFSDDYLKDIPDDMLQHYANMKWAANEILKRLLDYPHQDTRDIIWNFMAEMALMEAGYGPQSDKLDNIDLCESAIEVGEEIGRIFI